MRNILCQIQNYTTTFSVAYQYEVSSKFFQ